MASAVEPQQAVQAKKGLNAGAQRNLLSVSHPPPSPPATETEDDESDSENSPNVPPMRNIEPHVATSSQSRRAGGTNPEGDTTRESPVTSPVTSPPYWIQNHPTSHARSVSNTSVDSIPFHGITMRDNENSSLDERGSACWAKSVQVTDYTIVNNSTTNIGAFVVWNIKVETLTGSFMDIRKRYSEFDDFRWRLIRTFPNFEAAVPELPPKSLISKFRPRFLEKRRAGLQYFLNCILLNPEFSGSPVLKDFLFGAY
ncbi:Phox-like domain-containing protein [Xylariomycetidae sp. FL2044]|nr:Phox-like domain-containing protein [Xylariomycetidae sp. FL2044]